MIASSRVAAVVALGVEDADELCWPGVFALPRVKQTDRIESCAKLGRGGQLRGGLAVDGGLD
mgnify:CR=1 FL=1